MELAKIQYKDFGDELGMYVALECLPFEFIEKECFLADLGSFEKKMFFWLT